MAATESVVKRIEIRATATGINEARTQTLGLEQSLNSVAATNARLAASLEKYQAAQQDVMRTQESHISLLGRAADFISRFAGAYVTAKDALREWNAANDNGNQGLLESARNWTLFGRAVQFALGISIPFLRAFSLALTAITLPIEILGKARDDFNKLVEAGQRSQNLNIGVGFIQGFEKIGTAARLSREQMQKALETGTEFVRDTFGEENKLLRVLTDIENKTKTNLGSKSFASTASNEEERIRIITDAMSKLEASGQRLAALKLAESFGKDFAESLRTGQISFSEMAARVKEIAATDPIEQAKVDRAIQLNRAIEDTKNQISDALSVSVDMSGVHSAILGAWLSILQAVKTVVGWLNTGLEYLNSWDQKLQSWGKSLGGGALAGAIRGAINLGNNTLGTGGDGSNPLEMTVRPGRVIGSKPNALDIPKAAKAATEAADEYDRAVKKIQDSTRKLEEQAATFGKSAGEVERYRVQVELKTAAERAGKDITPELTAQINDLADKAAAAATKLDELRKQQEMINSLASAGTTAFSSIFKDMASGASAADALTKALGGVADSLTNIGKKSLDQSLTKGIQGLLSGGGLGGFGFDPVSLGIGAVGFGLSAILGNQQQQQAKKKAAQQKQLDDAKTQAEEAARKAEEINQAISTYLQRITAAAFAGQADTLENRLAQFDAKAQSERLDALSKGGAAINLLEVALGMERANIVTDWNKKIADDEKSGMEQRQAAIDAILQRQQSAQDRIFNAANDSSTLAGRMAALERQFARERFDEVKAGGEAMTDLLAAQDAERLRLLKDSSDEWLRTQKAAFDDAKSFLIGELKSIRQYLDSLTSGSQSPLSPAGRLAAAQSQFSTQLALAQGGNRDALSGITGNASALLEAARAQFASSAGYQTIFGQVQSQLGALPSQVSPEQFIVNAIEKQTDDLSEVFDSIDVNNDGVISRQEATNTFLASIFSELDTNGDNMLQKSELIRLNTGNTATATGNTDGYTQSLTTYSASINALTNTMVGIQTTMSSQLSTQIQQLTTAIINLVLMTKIVWNTAQLVTYTTNGFGSPQYAAGGLIDGLGGESSDSNLIRASRGEFVVRASAVRRIGLPTLRAINDNGALPASDGADYTALREEVRLLRQQLAATGASIVGAANGTTAAVKGAAPKAERRAPGAIAGRAA